MDNQGSLETIKNQRYELNKEFLITRATNNSNISKNFFHSATIFFQQSIRALFLLHGACATALIAHGEIMHLKCMLIVLAFGVLFAVGTSVLAAFAQRKIAFNFYDASVKADLYFRDSIEGIIDPKYGEYLKNNQNQFSVQQRTWYEFYGALISGAISLILFIVFICIFISS